jgi:hypothetical protein
VVSNQAGHTIWIYVNATVPGATTASFAPITGVTTGTQPPSNAIADLNGDGKLDVVLTDSGSANISVLLNSTTTASAPTFLPKIDFLVGGPGTLSVAVVDVSGDGKPDIVATRPNSSSLAILINTTAPGSMVPTFAVAGVPTAYLPYEVAVADFNGDGKPDLAVANRTAISASASIFIPQ